jgi:Trypsin-co-occurring domain 1
MEEYLVGQPVLVRAGNVEFFMEVADGGGPTTISAEYAQEFDGVRKTVEALALELTKAWDQVKPSEASVEFGLSVTAKTGRLMGLIVEGEGKSSLKVTLTWKAPGSAEDDQD